MKILTLVTRSVASARGGRISAMREAAGAKPSLRMLLNSVALVASTASTLVLGFVTWMLTARLFPASEVGIASGVIAAMMLCIQIALLGVNSAIVVLLPEYRERSSRVLNSAVLITTAAAVLATAAFLVLASNLFTELSVVAAIPSYTLLFIIMGIAGTLALLFDQASIAVHRSDQVLVRGLSNGTARLALVVILPFALHSSSSQLILLAWAIGSLGSCAIALFHLARGSLQYRPALQVDLPIVRRLVKVGLPNHALTLADRAPGLILPIIATEILSPTSGAHWYTVWMMAWIAVMIPTSVGMSLFAEVAETRDAMKRSVKVSLRTSLALGAGAAAVMALLASPLLSIIGEGYANAGVTPLRILVIAVFPLTLIQTFYAVCRATQRVREPIVMGAVSGVVGVGAAATAGIMSGLSGMAAAWISVQVVTSIWAWYRLRTSLSSVPVEQA